MWENVQSVSMFCVHIVSAKFIYFILFNIFLTIQIKKALKKDTIFGGVKNDKNNYFFKLNIKVWLYCYEKCT